MQNCTMLTYNPNNPTVTLKFKTLKVTFFRAVFGMIRERCHRFSKLVHTLTKNHLFLFSTTKMVVINIMGM